MMSFQTKSTPRITSHSSLQVSDRHPTLSSVDIAAAGPANSSARAAKSGDSSSRQNCSMSARKRATVASVARLITSSKFFDAARSATTRDTVAIAVTDTVLLGQKQMKLLGPRNTSFALHAPLHLPPTHRP